MMDLPWVPIFLVITAQFKTWVKIVIFTGRLWKLNKSKDTRNPAVIFHKSGLNHHLINICYICEQDWQITF